MRFVLVGGLAAQVHGASGVTQDADICPEWSTVNLARLAASLTELDARLKIGEGSIDTLEIQIDAQTIHNIEIGAWRTTAGDVDVLLGIPSESRRDLVRYEELAANAIQLRIDRTRLLVRRSPTSSARRRSRTDRRIGRRCASCEACGTPRLRRRAGCLPPHRTCRPGAHRKRRIGVTDTPGIYGHLRASSGISTRCVECVYVCLYMSVSAWN